MWSAVGVEDCALSCKNKDNCQAVAFQFLLPATVKNVYQCEAFYGCVSYYCPGVLQFITPSLSPDSRLPYSPIFRLFHQCLPRRRRRGLPRTRSAPRPGSGVGLAGCDDTASTSSDACFRLRRPSRSRTPAVTYLLDSEEALAEEPAAKPLDDSVWRERGWTGGSDRFLRGLQGRRPPSLSLRRLPRQL